MHRMQQISLTIFFCAVVFLLLAAGPARADKSAAAIQVPTSAAAGSKISVEIIITHNGNNLLHYTKWVRVTVNGAEAARWDFSWNRRPESETFSREISLPVAGPLTIEAEAGCNIHGSAGTARATVALDRQEVH